MARIDHNKQTGKKKKNSLTNATKIKVKKVSKMKTNQWCANYRQTNEVMTEDQKAALVAEFKCLTKHGYNVAEFNYDLSYAILNDHDGSKVPYVKLRPLMLQCEEEIEGEVVEEVPEVIGEGITKEKAHDLQDNIDDNSDEIINAELDSLTE